MAVTPLSALSSAVASRVAWAGAARASDSAAATVSERQKPTRAFIGISLVSVMDEEAAPVRLSAVDVRDHRRCAVKGIQAEPMARLVQKVREERRKRKR